MMSRMPYEYGKAEPKIKVIVLVPFFSAKIKKVQPYRCLHKLLPLVV